MILLSGCPKDGVHLKEKVVRENLSNWDRSIGGQSTPARSGEASTPRLVFPVSFGLGGNYSKVALIRAQESLSTAELSDDKPSDVIRTPSA